MTEGQTDFLVPCACMWGNEECVRSVIAPVKRLIHHCSVFLAYLCACASWPSRCTRNAGFHLEIYSKRSKSDVRHNKVGGKSYLWWYIIWCLYEAPTSRGVWVPLESVGI